MRDEERVYVTGWVGMGTTEIEKLIIKEAIFRIKFSNQFSPLTSNYVSPQPLPKIKTTKRNEKTVLVWKGSAEIDFSHQ